MSNRKNMNMSNATVLYMGCGSCRGISKILSKIFHPKPKPNKTLPTPRRPHNRSYSCQTTDTSTYYSDSYIHRLRAVHGFGKIGGESVAVEKDSDDPYLDFRQSMLQMILENEIYSRNDLKELLNCFLQLNEPYHHGTIVRVFTEIWNGVYSGRVVSFNDMHRVQRSREY